MYEENGRRRYEFYMAYGLAAAVLASGLALSSPYIAILSAPILLIAVILLHSGHIVNNLLLKRSLIVETSGNYRLGRNPNSISKRHLNSYVSVSMALLRPRSNQINAASLSELLDSINEHFEFSVELAEVDKGKIIEGLRTRLRMREIALTRANQKSYDRVNAIKRQIDIINGEISNLASGGKSFQFEIKLKSICASDDRSEAELYSSRCIEALASKFSAALGLDFQILSGERLLAYSGA